VVSDALAAVSGGKQIQHLFFCFLVPSKGITKRTPVSTSCLSPDFYSGIYGLEFSPAGGHLDRLPWLPLVLQQFITVSNTAYIGNEY